MKKIVFTIIVFAIIANVSAQLEVDSLGNVGIGGTIGTITNVPVTFKVNNSLAGFTGNFGNYNVSFGYGALPSNLLGRSNTAIGYNALFADTTGFSNTAIGRSALYNNIKGDNNTAIGDNALSQNTTGRYNVAIGSYNLYINTTGSFNTAINCSDLMMDVVGPILCGNGDSRYFGEKEFGGGEIIPLGNFSNTTAIGNGASITGDNQVAIGNSSVISAKIGVIWSTTSDGRAKKNVRANVPGLAFINRLQPITYNLDLDVLDELQKSDNPKINSIRDSLRMALPPEEKEIIARARADKEKEVYSGFVAQDVEKTAKSLGYDFNGVDAPGNDKGTYGLRYAEFVVPLVKAVQELSAKNDQLQEQVNELTELVNKLLGNGSESSAMRSENSGASTTGLPELAPDVHASLEQNIPNPFNHTTVIHYTLPETCTSAKILIANTGGHVIEQVPLSVSGGHDSVTIKGGLLQAGVYLYSLICDGKVVDTKRMVLTK